MIRRSIRALALAAALLGALAAGARAGDDDAPADKPEVTSADLEKRLDTNKVTVDWKDTTVLDGLNEIRQKSGVKFIFDQPFAEYADKRRVTFDGYRVPTREALGVLQKAAGFTFSADPALGGFKLKLDPSFATRAVLLEKRLDVEWNETAVSKAITDIEKKTGLKIQLHATMKDRLKSRKVTWEADAVTAEDAVRTLFVYPPPSIPARLETRPGNVVVIIYDGPPETKADVEVLLDERKLDRDFADAPLLDAAKLIGEALGGKCEVDKKLALEAKKVSLNGRGQTLRWALDQLAKTGGFAWKVTGAKVVMTPLEKK